MTDKQLKKLTRGELLQMLIAQTEKNDILTEQLEEASKLTMTITLKTTISAPKCIVLDATTDIFFGILRFFLI